MSKKLVGFIVVLVFIALWVGSSFAIFKGVMYVLNGVSDLPGFSELSHEPEPVNIASDLDMDIDLIESFLENFETHNLPMLIDIGISDDRKRIEVQDSLTARHFLRENTIGANYVEVSFKAFLNPSLQDFDGSKDTIYTQFSVGQGKSGNGIKYFVALEFFTTDSSAFQDVLVQDIMVKLLGENYDSDILQKDFLDYKSNRQSSETHFYKTEDVNGDEVYHTMDFTEVEEGFYRFFTTITVLRGK